MPAFNGDGPVPAEVPEDLAALATVNVSSGNSGREEEEEGQEEEPDSKATDGESREPLPRRGSRALRRMPDDDEDGDERVGESSPIIPKKDRTGLILCGPAPAPRRSQTCLLLPSLLRLTPAAGSRASSSAGGCLDPRATNSKCLIPALLGFCR